MRLEHVQGLANRALVKAASLLDVQVPVAGAGAAEASHALSERNCVRSAVRVGHAARLLEIHGKVFWTRIDAGSSVLAQEIRRGARAAQPSGSPQYRSGVVAAARGARDADRSSQVQSLADGAGAGAARTIQL